MNNESGVDLQLMLVGPCEIRTILISGFYNIEVMVTMTSHWSLNIFDLGCKESGDGKWSCKHMQLFLVFQLNRQQKEEL